MADDTELASLFDRIAAGNLSQPAPSSAPSPAGSKAPPASSGQAAPQVSKGPKQSKDSSPRKDTLHDGSLRGSGPVASEENADGVEEGTDGE